MKPILLRVVLLCSFCWAISFGTAYAQPSSIVQIGKVQLLGKTPPLSEMAPVVDTKNKLQKEKFKLRRPKEMVNFTDNHPMPTPFADQALPKNGDPLVQSNEEKVLFPLEPNLVLEGIDQNLSGSIPPDTNGDIGSNYYVQATNSIEGSVFEVWNKDGDLVFGPMTTNTFWTEFGVNGIGDPILLYDQMADRWLFTEINFQSMLIALSETNDPTGSWLVYKWDAPMLPDYPKYGIWSDAYYITTNEFFDDIPVYALDREAMLAGETDIDVQRIDAVPKFTDTDAFQVCTPVDWDGNNPPPPGAPGMVVRIKDDAWTGDEDAVEIWEIHLDWDDPDNTTVEGPISMPTAPFDSDLCAGNIFACIAQGDGTLVSALQQVVMHRVQYRNFGSYESIVLNHSVDVNPDVNQAGVRWYELRKNSGEEWMLYQQGTIAPDDQHRFMGSIAQDGAGNIMIGYAVTGSDNFLSLRYTGRLNGDPLGEMTIDEYEFATGMSINFNQRWGDYSSMVVDPLDNRTFWYTGEYMMDNNVWGTKIMNTVIQRDSNDIGVQALVMPTTSGFLTDAEEVTVEIRNYGYLPQEVYDVSYIFENGTPVTENVNALIPPDGVYQHTFTPTVNMEAIGDYDFTLYTTLATDTLYFNDTLRVVVSQLTRNDAGISDIEGIDTPICDDAMFSADLVLRNYGQENLTSVDIHYSINGGPDVVINWTGDLAPGETELVPITSTDFVDGTNEIVAFTVNPNGEVDEDMANDSVTRNFEMVTSGDSFFLELLTDQFPGETTWQLEDETGSVVYSGGPYSDPETLIIEEWCLPQGCYTFRIFDSFGDGMSWGGVEGSYSIVNSAGVTLAEIIDPAFGNEEENPFCTEIDCDLEGSVIVQDVSIAGADDGAIFVEPINGNSPFQYSNDGGATFQAFSVFVDLLEGDYDVVIVDAFNCEWDTTVTVGVNVSVVDLSDQVDLSITPNPTDGTVLVQLNGWESYESLPVKVYDASGKTVLNDQLAFLGGNHSRYISLDHLPAGMYHIRVMHEQFNKIGRVVKE